MSLGTVGVTYKGDSQRDEFWFMKASKESNGNWRARIMTMGEEEGLYHVEMSVRF